MIARASQNNVNFFGACLLRSSLCVKDSIDVCETRMLETTYTWEFDAAVTAFRGSSSLLDVQESELSTWGLDHTDIVRGGVVTVRRKK